MAVDFVGAAIPLRDIDLPMVAKRIGVGEDEIHAVIDTETAGTGFDSQKRPRMLFEPHIFYRLLKAKVGAAKTNPKLDKAVAEGLAYPVWGTERYPADSYPRIIKAMAIDCELALRSASWGLGQIMGFNFTMAGYTSASAMVSAFRDSEYIQLNAMISFIIAAGLDDELRRHDWAGFARGYNGAGFAKNAYDKKLASAFKKWQKIKDTPIAKE